MSRRLEQPETEEIIRALCDRFGIAPEVFAAFVLYRGAKGKVSAHYESAPEISGAAIIGLHIATSAGTVKPSTHFVQIFGRHFTRNVITVSAEVARELIAGLEVLPLEKAPADVTGGYVALACDGQPFMCGLFKNGEVRNMLPKSRRRILEFI